MLIWMSYTMIKKGEEIYVIMTSEAEETPKET